MSIDELTGNWDKFCIRSIPGAGRLACIAYEEAPYYEMTVSHYNPFLFDRLARISIILTVHNKNSFLIS